MVSVLKQFCSLLFLTLPFSAILAQEKIVAFFVYNLVVSLIKQCCILLFLGIQLGGILA